MASWAELLTVTEPGEHVVQLYGEDDQLLTRNVSRYLAEGLRRGDGLVVVATPEHTSALVRHLGEEEPRLAREAAGAGRLVYLDALETLARLLDGGRPEEQRFRTVIGTVLQSVRARSTTGSSRAFGEMVSLLWDDGRRKDAARLEALWNTILLDHECSLFCAYRIDLFAPAEAGELHPIVCSHDHVLAGAGTLLSGGRPRLTHSSYS
jgi:hypothetical protein